MLLVSLINDYFYQSNFIARPKFTQPLSNRDYTSDKPLRLNVRVEGNPVPEVKWLKVKRY